MVWSTLALTIRADATAAFEVVGASSFPRHWIYGHDGTLAAKTGLIDFDTWYRESFGEKNLSLGATVYQTRQARAGFSSPQRPALKRGRCLRNGPSPSSCLS